MAKTFKHETGWMIMLRGIGPGPVDADVVRFVEELEAKGHQMIQPPHIEERTIKQLVDGDAKPEAPASGAPAQPAKK